MSKNSTHFFSLVYELLKELADSLSVKLFLQGLWTPLTALSIGVGFIGLVFTPVVTPTITRLLFGALAEELTYRALIQAQFERSLPQKFSFSKLFGDKCSFEISAACILMSALFAAAHALTQSAFMSVLIFFPALILGVLWTRFRSTWLCTLVHFWYNFVFFYL